MNMLRLTNLALALTAFSMASCFAQIQATADGKFLQTTDGTPFFWLGDTDWEMCHRLTRDEIKSFVDRRSAQGFNVLHVVALAEMNGIREPNRQGDWPLNNEDPTQPLITPGNNPENAYEYDYWDHLEYIIASANEKDIYVGLLPTWGDKVTLHWGEGPKVFDSVNAEVYGRWIANRYARYNNIIWILGGDRPAVYKSRDDDRTCDDRSIWRAMARGIQSASLKKAFITYHPSGGSYSTSQFIHNEPWLDMNSFQSGHGSREADPWNWIERDLSLVPAKPVVDMEPCYEDHPVNPWDGKWNRSRGYFSAYDVRARVYRDVFSGAAGITYGHHQVWQFLNTDFYKPIFIGDTVIGWRHALEAAAANQMKHLKNLMLSRPYFTRISKNDAIVSSRGSTYIDLIVATGDKDGSYLMVYLPQSKNVTVDVSRVTGAKKNGWWFDPRTGRATAIAVSASKRQSFTPPASGGDWVLVIDDAARGFNEPGFFK